MGPFLLFSAVCAIYIEFCARQQVIMASVPERSQRSHGLTLNSHATAY